MKKIAFLISAIAVIGSVCATGCGSSEPEAKPPADAPKADDTKPADGSNSGAAGGTSPGTAQSTMGGPTNN